MVGCTSKKVQSTDPSGVYAREHSFTVKNPETDQEIGMRTIRDTILIRQVGAQYEVSNHKWMMNDYDKEGWRDMAHSDERPFATHFVELKEDRLEAVDFPTIFLDIPKSTIYVDMPSKSYGKVQ